MGCQIHNSSPHILCKLSTKKPTVFPSFLSVQSKLQNQAASSSSSPNSRRNQPPSISTIITVPQTEIPETDRYDLKFKTNGGCKLGISRYPDFNYNAEGGTGTGIGRKNTDDDDVLVSFDVQTLYIPPLMSATTKFLGLPLPPFLNIDIAPQLFQGTINPKSGKVNLEFKAEFWFSIGSMYRAPPLQVETLLTTEESKGTIRSGRGERLDEGGRCRLVGVATVQPIDDFLMNSFLGLPTECLANLNAIISFSNT